MRIIFDSSDKLINYLNNKLYINTTTDPSNLKYHYDDLVNDIESGNFFNLFTDSLEIFVYQEDRSYDKISLIDLLPLNAEPSFFMDERKAPLKDILEIAENLRYSYE